MKKSGRETKKQQNKPSNEQLPTNEAIQESLSRIPPEVLESLPEPVRRALQKRQFDKLSVSVSRTSVSSYQSSLPPVEFFESFEKAFPGWGKKLLELTEIQSQHRQSIERQQVVQTEKRMDRGQVFGFSVAILAIVGATLTWILAPPSIATSIAAFGLAIVGVGGPAVARLLATKFKWPTNKDT